jgi:hypothetical protein
LSGRALVHGPQNNKLLNYAVSFGSPHFAFYTKEKCQFVQIVEVRKKDIMLLTLYNIYFIIKLAKFAKR